jgi:hypothetical protein
MKIISANALSNERNECNVNSSFYYISNKLLITVMKLIRFILKQTFSDKIYNADVT